MTANLRSGRRADALARVSSVQEYLVFHVASDRLGLPLSSVKEILKLSPVTLVPRASPEVMGILSVRGRITTVLDLRRLLKLPESPPTRSARILLIERDDEVIGLRVDSVTHVVRLTEPEIEPASSIGGSLSEHVVGLGRPHSGDVVVLLDPTALLVKR